MTSALRDRTGAALPWLARTLLVGYLVGVAWLTLGDQPVSERAVFDRVVVELAERLQLAEDLSPSASQLEALANVLLFVPIGLLLPLALPRSLLTVLLAVAVAATVGIELVQLVLAAGRDPSVRDVAMNTLGAALGLAPGADGRRLLGHRVA